MKTIETPLGQKKDFDIKPLLPDEFLKEAGNAWIAKLDTTCSKTSIDMFLTRCHLTTYFLNAELKPGDKIKCGIKKKPESQRTYFLKEIKNHSLIFEEKA